MHLRAGSLEVDTETKIHGKQFIKEVLPEKELVRREEQDGVEKDKQGGLFPELSLGLMLHSTSGGSETPQSGPTLKGNWSLPLATISHWPGLS